MPQQSRRVFSESHLYTDNKPPALFLSSTSANNIMSYFLIPVKNGRPCWRSCAARSSVSVVMTRSTPTSWGKHITFSYVTYPIPLLLIKLILITSHSAIILKKKKTVKRKITNNRRNTRYILHITSQEQGIPLSHCFLTTRVFTD